MKIIDIADIIEMKFIYIELTKQFTDCSALSACPNHDNDYSLKHNFIGAN